MLYELDLSSNPISNLGIELISKNLGRNKSLVILKMSNINIDDESAEHISSMLSVNKFLKSFDISNN